MSVCLGPLAFCHLLKKSSGNPYLKMRDLAQYFSADAPMKKKNSFTSSHITFGIYNPKSFNLQLIDSLSLFFFSIKCFKCLIIPKTLEGMDLRQFIF